MARKMKFAVIKPGFAELEQVMFSLSRKYSNWSQEAGRYTDAMAAQYRTEAEAACTAAGWTVAEYEKESDRRH
jgi:hypothetical protein